MKKLLSIILLSTFFLISCQPTIPREALQITPQSLQIRQLETRYFDTKDEEKILVASAGLLQDLGFNIDRSETEVGYILGSKKRDATSVGQIAGAVLVALLGGGRVPVDKEQIMRACIVSHPYGEHNEKIAVRVTFQRIVWNTDGQITTRECITEPTVYQEFFGKLSKAVFLEANQI